MIKKNQAEGSISHLRAQIFSGAAASQAAYSAAALAAGILLMAACSQIRVLLPFTPVPLTGQTFGMLLLAFLWGGRLGFLSVLGFLAIGATSVPFFALGHSSIGGPSFGYLLGMAGSVAVVGSIADGSELPLSFLKVASLSLLGIAIVYLAGVSWLALFLPKEQLLTAGVYPFLLGEGVKIALVAGVVSTLERSVKHSLRE